MRLQHTGRRWFISRKAVLAISAFALVLSVVSPAESQEPGIMQSTVAADGVLVLVDELGVLIDQETVDYFVRVRAGYGLSSSLKDIQRVLDEYGVAFEWGFPLASEELNRLEDHLAIQEALSDDVILGFTNLPGYAGFYFDHNNGGTPTVLATDPDQVRSAVVDAMPGGFENQVIVARAEHSWSELLSAANAIVNSTNPTIKGQVHRVGIKVKTNKLEISVREASEMEAVRSALSQVTVIPTIAKVEPLSEPEVCTSRANCYSPMYAGVEVWGGGSGSTLGFGVTHNGDKQYVMAGHHSASSYTHSVITIGSTAENEYVNYGIDARAIYASDSQVRDDIYLSTTRRRDIVGTKYPSVGLSVCLSGMKTISCGTVQDNYLYYSTSTVSNLLGASADYNSQSGDSGGPVYYRSGSSSAYAVGLHSTGTGDREFARVYDFPSRMGAYILTS